LIPEKRVAAEQAGRCSRFGKSLGQTGSRLWRIEQRPASLRNAADSLWPGLMRSAGAKISGFLKRAPDFTAPF